MPNKHDKTCWRTARLFKTAKHFGEPPIRNKAAATIVRTIYGYDCLSGDWFHQRYMRNWKKHRKTQYK